jgi:hypothetical protein
MNQDKFIEDGSAYACQQAAEGIFSKNALFNRSDEDRSAGDIVNGDKSSFSSPQTSAYGGFDKIDNQSYTEGNYDPYAAGYVGAHVATTVYTDANGVVVNVVQSLISNDVYEHGNVIDNANDDETDEEEEEEEEDAFRILEPEEAMQIRLEGYLQKFAVGRSGFFANWKRRFFVCDRGVFAYMESATSGKALSIINLADGAGLRLVTRPSTRTHAECRFPEFELVLIFLEDGGKNERKLLLRADTVEDKLAWARLLGAFTPEVDHPMDYPL